MAVSGDWVTPRLNGIKYFEKPPLQYWATAAAYQGLRPARMDGATVAGADRLCRLGADPGYRRPAVRPRRRHPRDSHALRQPDLLADGAFQRAGHGAGIFHAPCTERLPDGQPARRAAADGAPLDADHLGGAGTRGTIERAGGPGARWRNAARLFAGGARFFALAAARTGARPAAFPAHRSALVRRRLARQSGVPALLLHPRARRALPHHDPSPLPAGLVLLRRLCGGRAALDRRDDPRPACAPPRRGARDFAPGGFCWSGWC